MGMNVIPLSKLTLDESKVMTLDIPKNMDPNDAQNEKSCGQLILEVRNKPFKEDEIQEEKENSNEVQKNPEGTPAVIIHEAEDLEGKHQTNPHVQLHFKGEERRTKDKSSTSRLYGTTTVAVIGSDAIYIAADGRTIVKGNKEHEIKTGCRNKIIKVSENIVVTMAGHIRLCKEMVKIAKEEVRHSKNIYKVNEACESFVRKWKLDNQNSFSSTLGIYGWDEQQPIMCFVGKRHTTENKTGSILASGTGHGWAKEHLNLHWKQNLTDDQYVDLMIQSVTASCLHDPNSGGHITVARISRGGGVEFAKNKVHVIKSLGLYYDELLSHLGAKLLCVSTNLDYSSENELQVQVKIKGQFGGVKEVRVFAVQTKVKLIIRIVEFVDVLAADRALGEGNCVKLRIDESGDTTFEILRPSHEVIHDKGNRFVSSVDEL